MKTKFERHPPIRLTISLDEETANLLAKLQHQYNSSKAEVIRKAVNYLDVVEEKGGASLDACKAYLDFLCKGEHIIVDVEHWKAIFSEIGEGSDGFWREVRDVGRHHWQEYYDKGLREVKDILEYVEKANWYRLSVDSSRAFTLILNVREAKRFVRTFFEGLFDASPHKVEITEGRGKIRINVME
ncbi:MAG: CopG family transcriptional regulator [Hadesarchaea archaeon]|nr:MAG: CopG family transcriptional regulator [Hadesarchaea archaeon]